ncbi:cell number regulator 2-like [Ziziphus jujuba]|uniref:Cell number regulator 2-like n=1 Tax=Ziziphus jujuba TaxID=326968 RepID=A0ABM3ZXE2_ZIZJJ|nr:cell number regulator 2-like [Ziziphus jujuba]
MSSDPYVSAHSSQTPPQLPHHPRPKTRPLASVTASPMLHITFGQISEIVDKGSSSCEVNGALYALVYFGSGGQCIYSWFYRTKMRQQYALKESPCCDCLVHRLCGRCALCQEHRELQNRGYNMILGWHGNVQEKNQEVAVAPLVEGGMSRK